MRPVRLPRVSEILWTAGAVLAILGTAFLVWGLRLSTAQWARILPGFDEAESFFGPSPAGWVPKVVAQILGLLTAILAAAALLVRYRETLRKPGVRARLFSAAVAVAACSVMFQDMAGRTERASWYNVQTMMTNPASVPVVGQRLLLIWPAMLLKYLLPRLSYVQAFVLIQFIAIVLSVYAIGAWSALFVGEQFKWLGQILLTVLLLPTMLFYQAHDIGVVFTYTFCFLFLYRRRYWPFLFMFGIGVLNHQNILLLIPTAVVVMWGREKTSTIGRVAALAAIAYFSIQFVLNQTIPVPQTHEDKVWCNMRQIVELHRAMVFGLMLTVPWYVGAAAVLAGADPFLKRAAILFPMQVCIYSVYGQLNEARLFHGFLPILIGIYLCYFRYRFLGSATPSVAGLAET